MAVYGQEVANSHRWHKWNQPNSARCSPEWRSPALFPNNFGMVNPAVLGAYTSLAMALGSVLCRWEGQRESLLLMDRPSGSLSIFDHTGNVIGHLFASPWRILMVKLRYICSGL